MCEKARGTLPPNKHTRMSVLGREGGSHGSQHEVGCRRGRRHRSHWIGQALASHRYPSHQAVGRRPLLPACARGPRSSAPPPSRLWNTSCTDSTPADPLRSHAATWIWAASIWCPTRKRHVACRQGYCWANALLHKRPPRLPIIVFDISKVKSRRFVLGALSCLEALCSRSSSYTAQSVSAQTLILTGLNPAAAACPSCQDLPANLRRYPAQGPTKNTKLPSCHQTGLGLSAWHRLAIYLGCLHTFPTKGRRYLWHLPT